MSIYLLVKEHNKTGLLYFCKTTRKNPLSYTGSGLRWKNHLDVHGKDITTRKIWNFKSQEECTRFALRFSNFYKVNESDRWANIIVENGFDGMPKGGKHSEETKQKMRKPKSVSPTRRPHSEETKSKMRGKRKTYKKSSTYWHYKWGPNPFKT